MADVASPMAASMRRWCLIDSIGNGLTAQFGALDYYSVRCRVSVPCRLDGVVIGCMTPSTAEELWDMPCCEMRINDM